MTIVIRFEINGSNRKDFRAKMYVDSREIFAKDLKADNHRLDRTRLLLSVHL